MNMVLHAHPSLLQPRGPVGVAERVLLLDSLAVMLVIVVPTIVATLAFAWWFRASNPRARRLPEWAYSGRIELVTWSVPLLTIMLLGGVTWVGAHALDPARRLVSKTPALEVQVVSLDWKWLFIYPAQHVASVNELVIPVATPVHFTLTSASVLNTFFVPQLGSMIYTMNGMADELNLQADRAGDYYGQSSHFSGDGFSDMHFMVHSVSDGGFASWVQTAQHDGRTLDASSYSLLARQSTNVPAFTYGNADSSLFDRIVSQSVAPGAGPTSGAPDAGTSPRTGL